MAEVTPARWSTMRAACFAEVGPSRHRALAQKDAAKEFITSWCKTIASNGGDEFRKEMGLQETVLETPAKKSRRTDEPGTD